MNEPVCRVDMDEGTTDSLDDLAISGELIDMVRLERMDSNCFWGRIYMKGGRDLVLSLYAPKGPVGITAEWE